MKRNSFSKTASISSGPISSILEPEEALGHEMALPGRKRWWWHRLTTPPELPGHPTFLLREAGRRARLLSTIVFFLILVVALLIPATLFIPNRYVVLLCLSVLGICVIALLLNRGNKVLFASILVVGVLELALLLIISSTLPFDINNLPLYDLLIIAELFAASLLPPPYIFVTALLNILFICGHLLLQRNFPGLDTSSLKSYLHVQFYAALARPASLEIIVGVVIYLWVRSTSQAIARADRAEMIARLEHELAAQKKQLETGIQLILQTHAEVANGNLSARTPLTQEHALWPLSNALNTLLTRFQRASQAEKELLQLQRMILPLVRALQDAEQAQKPLPPFPRTATSIDPLLAWLSGKRLASRPPSSYPREFR
jgi:hypothetical protein